MRKLLLLPLLLAAFTLGGQETPTEPPTEPLSPDTGVSPYSVSTSIDWEKRVLAIKVSLDFKKAGLALPEGRLAAERMVTRDLPGIAKDTFFAIPVDAEGTVRDRILDGSLDIDAILSLTERLRHVGDALSGDLLSFRSNWELPLSDVASLFVTWQRPREIRGPLDWVATKDYTGIVIFANGRLPVYGERNVTDFLRPGLFPRLFAADMGSVMDRWVVAPQVLVQSGPMGYVTTRSAADEARVGDAPLLIRATGLFGENRTDILIGNDDAARILASPTNRRLLVEGRVIVVSPRPAASAAGATSAPVAATAGAATVGAATAARD